mgnify:CR=1 FL=1
MERISKISQTNKIPKRQHKEKNSQSNNRYSEPKKKKENFKEILENEEKILEKEFLMLYSELGLQPKNIYELMENTGLKYEKLVEMLLQLQLKGLVEQPSYNYYSRLS